MHTKQCGFIYESQILSYLQRPVTISGDPIMACLITKKVNYVVTYTVLSSESMNQPPRSGNKMMYI